jgi:chemotaxis protein MotB
MSNRKPMDIDRLSNGFKIPTSAWIVTYADIMTIILTFFILLLSISTIAQTKYELIVQAFTGDKAGNLQEVQEDIEKVIEEQGLAGEIKTELDLEGLKVSFSNALLFASGKADLKNEALKAIHPIQEHLINTLGSQYGMIIEGYTDDVPIKNLRFRSNWELSTSRAISVMTSLTDQGFDRRRISIQGFADTRSATNVDLTSNQEKQDLDPEQLEQARSANRRVVLRIDALNPKFVQKIMKKGGWREPYRSTHSEKQNQNQAPLPSPTESDLLNPVPSSQVSSGEQQ